MTVAEWYARYQWEGRAWLPREGRQERHWLVRFRNTKHVEVYAHCFATNATLYLYAPDVPVTVTTRVPLVEATMDSWARQARHEALADHDAADD